MQTATSGVSYLLRNGRRIQTSVMLSPDLVYAYRQRNGLVIYALLSSQAEQLLMLDAATNPSDTNGSQGFPKGFDAATLEAFVPAVSPVALLSGHHLDSTCCRAITVTSLTPPRHHVRGRTPATRRFHPRA